MQSRKKEIKAEIYTPAISGLPRVIIRSYDAETKEEIKDEAFSIFMDYEYLECLFNEMNEMSKK